MALETRTYSALVVSASESFNDSIKRFFPPTRFHSVQFESNVSSAKRALMERSYDFVMVNSPLPDDPGLRFAIDCVGSSGTVAVVLSRAETFTETYLKASSYGVFALQKPTSETTMYNALRWMISARERLRRLEKKTVSLNEKMEEIRVVARAKCLLVEELKMTEPEAHRYIEKQAMDRCVTKGVVAKEIIAAYS